MHFGQLAILAMLDIWIILGYLYLPTPTCYGFDLETIGPPEWDENESGRFSDMI